MIIVNCQYCIGFSKLVQIATLSDPEIHFQGFVVALSMKAKQAYFELQNGKAQAANLLCYPIRQEMLLN